jgi:signal transduction histidine kinase
VPTTVSSPGHPATGPLAELSADAGAALLWAVLENMPEAITLSVAVRDADGAAVDMRLAYMNAIAREGQPDPAAAIGMLCSELWPPMVDNGSFGQCMRVLDTGEPVTGEFNWTQEGSYLPAGYDYRACRVGADTLVWVLRDSTERLHAAWELARSNADLSAFAHVVAHDLKAPLTAILGNAEILTETVSGEAERRRLAAIHRGGARMANLIDGVLTYSRVSDHTGTALPVHPLPVVRDVVADLDAGTAVQLVGEFPAVCVESVQLRQLLQNLIVNALKFGRSDRPPRVRVSAGTDGTTVEIVVADNGVGIPPDARPQVFALFNRLAATADRPGSGVGLATCARIVERFGGRIWVEDSPLGGAAIHFTLPSPCPRPVEQAVAG